MSVSGFLPEDGVSYQSDESALNNVNTADTMVVTNLVHSLKELERASSRLSSDLELDGIPFSK